MDFTKKVNQIVAIVRLHVLTVLGQEFVNLVWMVIISQEVVAYLVIINVKLVITDLPVCLVKVE